jgi:hypothetical protein
MRPGDRLERAVNMTRAILAAASLAGVSFSAMAQAPLGYPDPGGYQPQPSYQTQPGYQAQPGYQPQPAPQSPRMSPPELSNLVAPVALYPDLLLSQVLAASTYPLELVQAEQWMQGNPGLRGQQLVDRAKEQNWDPSIQALVAFPDVMNMLTRDIQWTTDLGNAFLAQQADVMDAIQRLRASARANGRLTDTPQQNVIDEQQNGQDAIEIQPTDPQVVYPPVYNPAYVWGPPVYGVYPPLGYPGIGWGITYGVATFLGALFTGMLGFGGWGWGLSWLTHGLFLNGLFFSHFGFHGYGGYGFHGGPGYAARAAWVHDPGHRLGVPYGHGYSSTSRGSNSGFANYSGRSYTAGRSGYAGSSYRDSGFHSGSQGSRRQMEAYRGLSAGSARGGYGGEYRGGSSYAGARNYAGAASQGYRGGYSGAQSFRSSGFRDSGGRSSSKGFSSPHYSAPKSSSHFGGGGHSGGGHGHSGGGGGHSHGGSHKK